MNGAENDRASSKGVLLLHGARFQAKTWVDLGTLEVLREKGIRAVALDLPGYGGSEPSELAPEAFLAACLETLHLDRVVLVAPSMSGCFAFPFVTLAQAKLAGAVWIAPACLDACPSGSELPSLIVWGEGDEVVPVEAARELAQKLPRSEIQIFAGRGHPCYLEDPERFHSLLEGFVGRIL